MWADNGQCIVSVPDVFFSSNVFLPQRIAGCLRSHMHAHAPSRTDSSGLWLCPRHPGQSAGRQGDGAGEKRGKEIEMERERRTKGQEDKDYTIAL